MSASSIMTSELFAKMYREYREKHPEEGPFFISNPQTFTLCPGDTLRIDTELTLQNPLTGEMMRMVRVP